ncbi:aldehyde dehydrogenase family protein [Bacillus sp. SL00103]
MALYVLAEERASVIFSVSRANIRRKKHEYSALLVKEAGKPWNEADAIQQKRSTSEYYARQMLELAKGKPVNSHEGEHNQYVYTPTGVTSSFRRGTSCLLLWQEQQ